MFTARRLLSFAVACCLATSAVAQTTSEDYARAERLLGWNAEKLVFHFPVDPQWVGDSDTFWYRKRVPSGHEFIYVNPADGTRRQAFDHSRLAASLSEASGRAYEAHQLPFEEITLLAGGTQVRFWEDVPKPADSGDVETKEPERRWTCDLATYVCTGPEDRPADGEDEVASPDGSWLAFVRDENLWVRPMGADGEADARQLSKDGVKDWGYGSLAEGCCSEVTSRRNDAKRKPAVFWSPDSSKIAVHRVDEREVDQLHLIETHEGRPVLHSYRYALPGDESVPMHKFHVFDVATGNKVDIESPAMPVFWAGSQDVRWSQDSTSIFFLDQQRGHQKAVLYRADVASGESRVLLEETSNTFLDFDVASADRGDWWILGDGEEIVWRSDRDGWGHFYLFDGMSGALKNRITAGSFSSARVHHVDEAGRWLYFNAYGKEEGVYPYAVQLYRARLDGSALERVTPEDAHHEISMPESGSFVIDTFSTRQTDPVTVVRSPDGAVVMTLERADTAELRATGFEPAELFSVKARDGATDLYGFLYRPSNFDPELRYPIVDYIYPGPQIGAVGARGFTVRPRGFAQALAELGFVVMQLDAIGTPFRSKAFHAEWYGDMTDNGLIDHIQAIKQLAVRHPEIDIDRVGIYGHSGGGFSSTDAILRYPEFFKVAVSGAGNHDNRSYSYGWGEKYQGLLAKKEDGSDNYDSQANHRLAENLEGHLLLTYGTLDDNVHPNATLLLVDALIEHNKTFDMLVLPNRNHGYSREPYIIRRTWDYFVEHLKGDEPPAGYKIEAPPQ